MAFFEPISGKSSMGALMEGSPGATVIQVASWLLEGKRDEEDPGVLELVSRFNGVGPGASTTFREVAKPYTWKGTQINLRTSMVGSVTIGLKCAKDLVKSPFKLLDEVARSGGGKRAINDPQVWLIDTRGLGRGSESKRITMADGSPLKIEFDPEAPGYMQFEIPIRHVLGATRNYGLGHAGSNGAFLNCRPSGEIGRRLSAKFRDNTVTTLDRTLCERGLNYLDFETGRLGPTIDLEPVSDLVKDKSERVLATYASVNGAGDTLSGQLISMAPGKAAARRFRGGFLIHSSGKVTVLPRDVRAVYVDERLAAYTVFSKGREAVSLLLAPTGASVNELLASNELQQLWMSGDRVPPLETGIQVCFFEHPAITYGGVTGPQYLDLLATARHYVAQATVSARNLASRDRPAATKLVDYASALYDAIRDDMPRADSAEVELVLQRMSDMLR
ncbi:MAG: hypothetical protein ACYSVY_09670 [Planctomycetota bacterium]